MTKQHFLAGIIIPAVFSLCNKAQNPRISTYWKLEELLLLSKEHILNNKFQANEGNKIVCLLQKL